MNVQLIRESHEEQTKTSSFIKNPTQNKGKKKISSKANAIHPPEEIFLVLNGRLVVPQCGQRKS